MPCNVSGVKEFTFCVQPRAPEVILIALSIFFNEHALFAIVLYLLFLIFNYVYYIIYISTVAIFACVLFVSKHFHGYINYIYINLFVSILMPEMSS